MKTLLFLLAVFPLGLYSTGIGKTDGPPKSEHPQPNRFNVNAIHVKSTEETRTINLGDTVVFDLSGVDNLGTQLFIPVSIISDDEVYALDFSLKYNEDDYLWDTILLLPGNNLQSIANYNVDDSTLRFTSNSLNQYILTAPIVNIRFNVLTGSFEPEDLHIVAVYLNGEPCSYKIKTNGTITGTNSKINKNIIVFQNPSTSMLILKCNSNALAEIYDLNGKLIRTDIEVEAGIAKEVPTHEMTKGVYFVKIVCEGKADFKKFLVE